MYKCHICQLETKQLNGLMSRHYKKHCSETYSAEQYKIDLLAAHGRPQKICKHCNLPTVIPKGEAEYPETHKECYLSNISGDNNPNYQGGLIQVNCALCNKELYKHKSHLTQDNKFCSASCSINFYNKLENQSPATVERLKKAGQRLNEIRDNPDVKRKAAIGKAKAFKDRASQLEKNIYKTVLINYPDAKHGVALDFYTVDIFLENTKQIIEVQGDYWHSLPHNIALDKRKQKFFTDKGYTVHYIYEHEWEYATDKLSIIENALNNVTPQIRKIPIIVIAGASGSGKTWIIDQLVQKYSCIHRDSLKTVHEDLRYVNSSKTILMGLHNGVSTFIRRNHHRFDIQLICLTEDEKVLTERIVARGGEMTSAVTRRTKRMLTISKHPLCIFSGTSSEALAFLKSL